MYRTGFTRRFFAFHDANSTAIFALRSNRSIAFGTIFFSVGNEWNYTTSLKNPICENEVE